MTFGTGTALTAPTGVSVVADGARAVEAGMALSAASTFGSAYFGSHAAGNAGGAARCTREGAVGADFA